MVMLTAKWVQSSELSFEANDARDNHFANLYMLHTQTLSLYCPIAVTGNTPAGGRRGSLVLACK